MVETPILPVPGRTPKSTEGVPSIDITRRQFLIAAGAGAALLIGGGAILYSNQKQSPGAVPPIPGATAQPKSGADAQPQPTAAQTKFADSQQGDPNPDKTKFQTLRENADASNAIIGVNFENVQVAFMASLFKKEFNLGVISPGMLWSQIEPEQNKFDFKTTDTLYNQFGPISQAKMKLRASHLVYPQRALLPEWLVRGNFQPDQLREALRNHILQIVSRYKGGIQEYTVVNEPYVPGWRQDDIFYKSLGPEYYDIAFITAHEADPNAVLILNDNDNHTASGKTTKTTKEIITRLSNNGSIASILGVGLEMHLNGANDFDKSEVIRTMREYGGIPIYVTELDVNMKDVAGTKEGRFNKQADIYKKVFEAAFESGVCRSITVWNVGDKYSWIERNRSLPFYSPEADPTLFDDDLQPKPAYFAVLDVLKKL